MPPLLFKCSVVGIPRRIGITLGDRASEFGDMRIQRIPLRGCVSCGFIHDIEKISYLGSVAGADEVPPQRISWDRRDGRSGVGALQLREIA